MLKIYYTRLSVLLAICFFTTIITLPRSTHGLNCYVCNPCKNEKDGKSEPCKVDGNYKYPEILPEKGEMSCLFDYGPDNGILKRCQWIREDPDLGKVDKKTRCFKHPSGKEYCTCFKDDCTKEKPVPDSDAEAIGHTSGSVNKVSTSFAALTIVYLGILLLVL